MDILKARDLFNNWTRACLENYLSSLNEQQQFAIRLIPLIFQTNHRMLPAYVSADTPAGIYGYKPSKKLIKEARKLNRRFAFSQDAVLKNTLIDAVYLQMGVIDQSVKLILIHKPEIANRSKQELMRKMQRMIRWLDTEHLKITGLVCTIDELTGDSLLKHACSRV